ncbi:ATP-grasp domain-containing protein [Endothiovibrio diazotrophicus]
MPRPPKTLLTTTLRAIDEETTRVVVETLREHSDLTLVHPAGYDFAKRTVQAWRYHKGYWHEVERQVPRCDLWVVWIDGYALDHRALGYRDEMDYHGQMNDFFESLLADGRVGAMQNSPAAERNTLKGFLADLDPAHFGHLPTHRFDGFDELADLFRTHGPLVVKPQWGGLRKGVAKIESEEELLALRETDLTHRVAQAWGEGAEKRLWIADGRVVAGGAQYGKRTPWSDYTRDFRVERWDDPGDPRVAADIERANRMAAEVGLTFGSVDFIGERINEINGGGTGHVMWNLAGEEVVDARGQLREQLLALVAAAGENSG